MKNILNKNKINDNNLNLTTNLSDIQHCDLLIESIISGIRVLSLLLD